MEWLNPFTLQLALFRAIILEVLLGVALLLGYQKKRSDCCSVGDRLFHPTDLLFGLFQQGDRLRLSVQRSQSYALAELLQGRHPVSGHSPEMAGSAPCSACPKNDGSKERRWACVAGGLFPVGQQRIATPPFKDFRPYACGKSIKEGMMSAEERGHTSR